MEFKIDYSKKEAERFSKLIISYLVLVLGIIFLIGMLNITSISFFDDFITPIIEWFALLPIWYAIAAGSKIVIESFWPLLLIYYGAHWVLKFERKPGAAKT